MLTLPVPLYVVEASASAVLRARPGRRAQVLAREIEAFRVQLVRQGLHPEDASTFAKSFGQNVAVRLERAGGAVHH